MKERIKEIRKDQKMTQKDFANKIGIKQSAQSHLEAGRNDPNQQTIQIICHTFNVNEEWLRYGTGEKYIQLSEEEELAEWMGKILYDKGVEAAQVRLLAQGVKAMCDDGTFPVLMSFIDKLIELKTEQKERDEP